MPAGLLHTSWTKKEKKTIESILFLFPTTAIRQRSEWGILHRVALKGWSVQPQDLLFTHRFCDHVPNFKKIKGVFSFSKKIQILGSFFHRHKPRHTQETTHTHTWNKLPPSRRTAIGWTRDPCLPNVPVSHFSYLTSHWTVFKKRRMQQNQNGGTRMPNGAMKSDFWEPAERARLLLKHARTLLFPRTRDGRCVAAFRWKKKHISELNWRVPYRKFKQLETPSMKRLGKRWKTD